MRFSFEKKINNYNEALKESLKDFSKEGRQKYAEKKLEITGEAARATRTNQEAELAIFDIQKQKLERIKKFKKFLNKTRNGEGGFVHPEIEPGLPVISKDSEGNLVVSRKEGRQKITLGELITDPEWGIDYTFDSSVDIHTIRGYYLENLKGELRTKLDQQIVASESTYLMNDTYKQDAYKEIGKRLEHGSEQQGIIAEKMVKNFLKKLSIDANADFEIIDANAFQDVEQKVDFIIHRKNTDRARGAAINESDQSGDIGIQFTTNEPKAEHKQGQIDRVKRRANNFQDIVLVTLPPHDASMLYKKWAQHKESGGPEKMWTNATRETIFRGVMNKVLTAEEIDAFCEKNFTQ